jgi:molybdopterin-guanine dinucleotide biosynthesis protein A
MILLHTQKYHTINTFEEVDTQLFNEKIIRSRIGLTTEVLMTSKRALRMLLNTKRTSNRLNILPVCVLKIKPAHALINLSSTAILIFSRTASEEASAKKYGRYVGKKAATQLAEVGIQHTISAARNSGLPVYQSFSNSQCGDSFGERLANSIEGIFSLAYEKVIVIGTDCPSINSQLLKNIAQHLENNDVVLGPAEDGGVYVIGLARIAYKRNEFIDLPWLSNDVLDAFTASVQQSNMQVVIEAIEQDTDDLSSLFRWLACNTAHPLSCVFISIIALFQKIKKLLHHIDISIHTGFSTSAFRGPPAFYLL